MDIATPVMDDQTSRLLALPPELRNRIYRYVLVQDNLIQFPHQGPFPDQPNLLGTCRQIRRESYLIYLKENHFFFQAPDFDATNNFKWLTASRIRRWANVTATLLIVQGTGFKENLLRWIEARHHGHIRKRPGKHEKVPYMKAAARVFEVAKKLREEQSMEWEEIKPILEEMLAMLGDVDSQWAS